MSTATDADLNLLFLEARTHSAWLDKPVEPALMRRLYEVARMGPSSANSSPMRLVFVQSAAAKERLKPALSPGNVTKTMNAPVTAIVAYDLEFYEKLPKLSPHADMRSVFASLPLETLDRIALQSSSIQGGTLIAAARALGLDCGPMGGFNNALVDAAFFPDGKVKSNFLLNLGYGDASKLHPRNPRLSFEEAARIE